MSEPRSVFSKIRMEFLLAGLSLAIGSYFLFSPSSDSKKSIAPYRDHLPASVEESSVMPSETSAAVQEETVPTKTTTAQVAIAKKTSTTSTSSSSAHIESVPDASATPSPVATPTPMAAPAALAPAKAPIAENGLVLPKIDFWIWAGVGVNYTSSSQSVEGFSDLEFGRIKSPSTMLRAGFYISDHAGLDLGFKSTPGEAKSSESITVNNGSYNWLTMSAEALYRPTYFAERSEWTWRLGLQQHQMPFLFAEGVNQVSMVETSMTNLSLGFEYKKQLKKRLRFEWLMRYQYPIAASNTEVSNFSVSPNVGFDGSLGTAYQLGENTFIGIYWYGQYHGFDFKYQTESAAEVSGRQSLFFTNFDLRLGMEF